MYGGKVYKKCEVEAFVNSLAANASFKARLLKDMKKVSDNLANLFCEIT